MRFANLPHNILPHATIYMHGNKYNILIKDDGTINYTKLKLYITAGHHSSTRIANIMTLITTPTVGP